MEMKLLIKKYKLKQRLKTRKNLNSLKLKINMKERKN